MAATSLIGLNLLSDAFVAGCLNLFSVSTQQHVAETTATTTKRTYLNRQKKNLFIISQF